MYGDTAVAAEPPTPRGTAFTYDAFLSYSRRDAAVADGIQKGLHLIGRRAGRLHALRVFRDKTDLAASPNLWGKITDALDRSRYLIVVLSPRAVASEWVDKEVAYWLQHRGPENLQLVVADGHLEWDEANGRFDPDRSDAALPVLTQPGALGSEPIYVDVSGDAPWDANAPMFRDKVTDLAAPIHGKPKYELASDDVREQRRFRRLRRAAVIGLVTLTVLALAAAGIAVVQRQEAARQRAEAIHQRNQAIALKLTSQGESMLSGVQAGGDVRAVQQILAAQHVAPTADKGALFTAVIKLRHTIKNTGASSGVWSVAFSPDGTRIVSGTADNTVQVWNAATGQPVGQPMTGHTGSVHSVAFSPDGKRIVSGSADTTVRVWDVETGRQVRDPMSGHTGEVWSVAFSPDGKRIVSGSSDNTVRVWDVETGRQVGDPMTGHTEWVWSVAFSPDGQQIVAGSQDASVRVWPAPDQATSPELLCGKLTANMSRQQWRDWVSPDIDYIAACPELPVPD